MGFWWSYSNTAHAHGLLVELLHMLGVVPLRRVVGEMGVAIEGFWGHCLCRVEASEGKNK